MITGASLVLSLESAAPFVGIHVLKSYREKPLILFSVCLLVPHSFPLPIFSISFSVFPLSSSYLSLFSILCCSNFPLSSQPVRLWRLITILADVSFHFLSSSPVLFLASHPLNPASTNTHPTAIFFSFLLCLSLFLQSFSSSFRTACFFQCSEVMVEYSGSVVGEKEGTICSLCSERGRL